MADLETLRRELHSPFVESGIDHRILQALLDIIETAPKGCCCSQMQRELGRRGSHQEQCKKRQEAWERLNEL